MDLEDWELLPRDPYKGLDHDDEDDHEAAMKITRNTEKSLDMDYFICPTQASVGKTEFHQRVVPTQLLHVPVTWEPVSTVEDTDIKKNQDMTIDLPERFASPLPQNDEEHTGSGGEYHDEMGTEVDEGGDLRSKKEIDWEEEENICGEKMNKWKMGLHGIGAICSFGVAAATFCVFFLGHNNSIQGCRNKNKNQILRFQIYSDDNKRMNEVVKRATNLNEAISVMKSLPVARAQISFGGYYDAL
ncbi:uncharacterized protein LOC108843084 [Raphanus sativus]|uniref:Uncharacterized protein LOC108843084 n=1 Tax=Raphanus sativus TaxID=3726 RepID=A0A9W3DCP3_RAPSA|nr:uncharacterized protein LOC108843084 [Raphanus sativus]